MISLKPKLIESIPLLGRHLPYSKSKIWIEAYGCSASMADAEMIGGILKSAGYEAAAKKGDAALNLIVTCSVKDTTEHRMMHRIKKLTETGKPLVVAGCLPKADTAKVESLNPFASLLGPHSIDKTLEVVGSALSGQRYVALDDSISDKVNVPRIRFNPAVSIVEIASGCMSECTFCQTKLAKGWLRSYRIGDITRQIKNDVRDGCKEVWLTSTDNGCYGKDIGADLVELLKSCCSIEGDFKVRLGMMNPMYLPGMLERMVDIFCGNEKIFKFLHIPVQSGSERILRKMKRGHSAKLFVDAVKAFRKKIPEMAISTDVIVGFPSETEDDFQKTLELLKETEPDIINSSKYSPRPGTPASRLKKVSSHVVKERTERLHLIARQIMKKRNSLWQGWKGEVIVDEINGKTALGRNYAYKSVVIADGPKLSLGTKLSIKVYDFSNYSLKGKAVQ